MSDAMKEATDFIQDYLTRYKEKVTLSELREDYMIQFEDTEYGSVEFFHAVWNKLKSEGAVIMVMRSRPGQESEYQWRK